LGVRASVFYGILGFWITIHKKYQRNMNVLLTKLTVTLLLLAVIVRPASCQQVDMPMTAEDSVFMQELRWAEHSLEKYRRKNGDMPIRSSIRAVHIHSESWRQDSIEAQKAPWYNKSSVVAQGEARAKDNLRGSKSDNGTLLPKLLPKDERTPYLVRLHRMLHKHDVTR
jgi:hypothetical protein